MAFALGVTHHPSFHPQLRVIAEYDSKDFALGSHLSAVQASACAGRNAEDEIFHGGLTYKIHLK